MRVCCVSVCVGAHVCACRRLALTSGIFVLCPLLSMRRQSLVVKPDLTMLVSLTSQIAPGISVYMG